MKKKLVTVSIVLLVILLVLGLVLLGRHRAILQDNARDLLIKTGYATDMGFTVSGEYTTNPAAVHLEIYIDRNLYNPDRVDYTELVFVYYYEEATQFDEHVLVAWPSRPSYGASERAISTQGRVDLFVLRMRLDRPDVDFRDYGLPADEITLIDVVDNWEIVHALIRKYRSSWR
jgi:hypothetical protein